MVYAAPQWSGRTLEPVLGHPSSTPKAMTTTLQDAP